MLSVNATAPEGRGEKPATAPLRRVTLSEAKAFLVFRRKNAVRVSVGILLCILSPAALILLAVARETGLTNLTGTQSAGVGLLALFLMVGCAVALFVFSGVAGKPYEYLREESFDVEHGVAPYVKARQEASRRGYTARLVSGVVLCVLAAAPIFIAMLLPENSDFYYALAVVALLALAGAGAALIVYAVSERESYAVLLEEGEHSRAQKSVIRSTRPVVGIYWSLVTAVYLTVSFITMQWDDTWIIWPIAGALFGVVYAVAGAFGRRDG